MLLHPRGPQGPADEAAVGLVGVKHVEDHRANPSIAVSGMQRHGLAGSACMPAQWGVGPAVHLPPLWLPVARYKDGTAVGTRQSYFTRSQSDFCRYRWHLFRW